MEPVGLINLNNSCFMNSALQVLFQNKLLVDWFMSNESLGNLELKHDTYNDPCIIRLVYDALKDYKRSQDLRVPASPLALFEAIPLINAGMTPGKQEDAWEYLTGLLDKIHSDFLLHMAETSLNIEKSVALSPIFQAFNCTLQKTVTCTSCAAVSAVNLEDTLHVVVDISSSCSTNDALDSHFSPFSVKAQCTKCSPYFDIVKIVETKIVSISDCFLFCLKRFNNDGSKITEPIIVNEFRVINNDVFALQGIILHHGPHAGSGHFTSCFKVSPNKWLHFDDAQVTEIDLNFILDPIVSQAAYGFMYRRVGSFLPETHQDPNVTSPEIPAMDTAGEPPYQQEEPSKTLERGVSPEDDEASLIDLEEDEVPGAMLPANKKIKSFKRVILIRWLQCRNIDLKNAKLPELIKRVEDESKKGTRVWKGIENGTWLRAKIAKMKSSEGLDPVSQSSQTILAGVIQEESSTIVELTEDDVEGAKIPTKPYNSTTVVQLKTFLTLRGQDVTGNKPELWERVQQMRESGLHQTLHPGIQNQFWYKKKQAAVMSRLGLHPIREQFPIPSTGWKKFPSVAVPQHFNEGMAFNFLIERHPNDESRTSFHTSRPGLRAKKYVDSGYVTVMEDCCDNKMYYIKCKIKASWRDLFHQTAVVISKNSGFVLYGDCDCIASALGRCSHVAALLQCLWTYNLKEPTGTKTCTSLPQSWGHGASRKAPGVIRETDYASRKWVISEKANFEPRAVGDMFRSPTLELALEFRKSLPNGPALLWHDVLPRISSSDANDDTGTDNVGSDLEEAPVIRGIQPLPPAIIRDTRQLPQHSLPCTIEDSSLTLQEKCLNFLESLQNLYDDGLEPCYVEIQNTEQGSTNWFIHRGPFVTSSKAKQVKGLTSLEAKRNFLMRHMWQLKPFTSEAMQYGIKNEPIARAAYLDVVRLIDPNVRLLLKNLCVNKKFPMLRCSPDGNVIFTGNKTVLLEIKCPFILREHDPNKFDSVLTKEQLSRFHLIRRADGTVVFRATHTYYHQIQFSMGVLGINVILLHGQK